jgi:V/A-type H+-transporting ATPase subunit I
MNTRGGTARAGLRPVRMVRVALVAPDAALEAVLREVGTAGVVQLEPLGPDDPAGSGSAPGTLGAVLDGAVREDGVAAYLGWCPRDVRPALAERIRPLGGGLAPLAPPAGVDPPTLLAPSGRVRRSFLPLLETYGTVPYDDIDPTLLAGIAYVVMFGMMFGDVGHGLVLLALAVALRLRPPRRFLALRDASPFIAGAGLASAVFGLLYGESFGPTGLVPTLWLAPLDEPVRLLVAGVTLGGGLLGASYLLGIVNRWREGGTAFGLYAPSGIAGAAVFIGLGALGAGVYVHATAAAVAGAAVAAGGLALAGAGLHAAAGRGAAAAVQTVVQLIDLVVRIGANLVSFARLAAFGLTHAALGGLVWSGTTALWHRGDGAAVAAVVVFAAGNAIAFGLEALVAGVQALRLEYYELFSRVFDTTGRPFRPWRLPPPTKEVPS